MEKVYCCGSPHKKITINRNKWYGIFSFMAASLFIFGFSTKSYAQYCVPSATNSSRYINDFSTSNAITNLSNMGSGFSTNGYGDFTADTLYVVPGGVTVNFSANIVGGSAGFRIWIDAENDGNFTGNEVFQSLNYSVSPTGGFTVPATVGSYRMRIGSAYIGQSGPTDPCVTGFTYGEFEDYIVKVFTPSCMPVSNITLDNLAPNNDADISWTAGGAETTWDISWGPSGYTPGDANEIGNEVGWTTGTNYTITGLGYSSTFDVYVKADCGGGNESVWGAPLTITTPCAAVIAPWTYDVETATGTTSSAIEDCWSSEPNNTSSSFRWNVRDNGGSTPSSNTGPDSPHSGNNYFYTEASSGSQGDSAFLVTPPIDLSALTIPVLNFYYHMYGQTMGNLYVQVSSDNGLTWTTEDNIIGEQQTSGSDPWGERFIVLSSYSGTVLVRFVGVLGSSFEGDMSIDDISVIESPSCLKPKNLATTAMTDQTADITWTAGNTETQWGVSWGIPGYTPGDANEIGVDNNVTANPYQITGLTADTHYDVYVRAICGAGDTSVWAGPLDIFTGYCEVSTTYTTYYLTSVASDGAVANVGYSATSQPSGSYANETAQTFTSYEGQTFDINTNFSTTSNGVNIWVDWNNNMSFEPGELMASEASTVASKSFQITVPTGTPQGDYRVRVRGQYGSTANPPACGEVNYGTTVDFKLTIVATPTCLQPTDIIASSVTDSTVIISWTAGGSESSWNIVWGPPGFVPGDPNQLGSATSGVESYTITGLTANSEYDVYVQADCGGGDESYWAGPMDFQNYYCIPDPNTSATYYIDDITTIGALTNLNNVGSGIDPNGYGDYTATDTLVVYPGQIFDFNIQSGGTATQKYFVWIDWFQNSNFDDPIDLIESTTTYSNNHTFTYTVPMVPEMTTRMRVRALGSGTAVGPCDQNNYTETEDYIIKIVAAPTCLPPINLDSLSATTTEIEISWDEQNTASNWSIEYGPFGFTPGTGTIISGVGTNPYTITGLNPSSTYDFYVQSDCGGGDESYWGGPLTASTQCGVTPAPFYEGFSTGELPICWSNLSSDPSTSVNNFWLFSAQGDYGAANNGKPAGTFAKSDGSTPNPDSMMLATPEIDLSPLTNPTLSFEWFSNNTDNPGDNVPLIVLVTTDNINWITLDTLMGDNADWQFASYSLSAYANQTIRVIFMTNQTTTTSSAFYNDILLDDVRIDNCIGGQPGSKDVCRLDGTINLNDNIIIPPNGGGKWYGSVGMSTLITNDSILNVSSLPAGSYEVYYSERTVCYDTTVATINIYGPSSAGQGNTIHSCKNAPLNLFGALSGNTDMGGDWYDYGGNLLPNSQPTSPDIPASYNYKYIVSNGVCPADTSIVELVVDDCIWVGLDEEAFTNISVYPNPATEQINIVNPSNASDLKVQVLDMNGREVLVDNDVMKNSSKATIAIGQLAKGVYTLRVYNSEGQKIFKVVKQ